MTTKDKIELGTLIVASLTLIGSIVGFFLLDSQKKGLETLKSELSAARDKKNRQLEGYARLAPFAWQYSTYEYKGEKPTGVNLAFSREKYWKASAYCYLVADEDLVEKIEELNKQVMAWGTNGDKVSRDFSKFAKDCLEALRANSQSAPELQPQSRHPTVLIVFGVLAVIALGLLIASKIRAPA